VVIRSVLGDQRNLSISSFKRGNFRLGELNPKLHALIILHDFYVYML